MKSCNERLLFPLSYFDLRWGPKNGHNARSPLYIFCLFGILERFAFHTPVEEGRIMSCPPSVRLSVNFSCPLHNSDTVQDIFMKLGTNINHHQTMCGEQEPTLHLHFYGIMALINFYYDNRVLSITLIPSIIFS